MTYTSYCKHCQRAIVSNDRNWWVDPEATGDDSIWREVCDSHDTYLADHEPETYTPYLVGTDDGGPYDIMGHESEFDLTLGEAIVTIEGFYQDANLEGHRNVHGRVYRGDDYIAFWTPANGLEMVN